MLALLIAQTMLTENVMAVPQTREWHATCPFGRLDIGLDPSGHGEIMVSGKRLPESSLSSRFLGYLGESRRVTILCAVEDRMFVLSVEGFPQAGTQASYTSQVRIDRSGVILVGKPFSSQD